MPKLIDQMKRNKLFLIVALPSNDPELAKAALAGGADALQLSLNAKGTGGLSEEKADLENIIGLADIPVGLVPGRKGQVSETELKQLAKMGFDYFSFSLDNLPDYYANIKGVTKVLALGNRFTIDLVLGVGEYGADAVNAAIIPLSEQGRNLMVGDLQNYISIVISAGIPVIIPTQRAIKPSEVAIIADTEAKGLLLTPVVLGTTAKHIETNTKEFRVAVDDLG
ncbi:MAG: hypothetical protein JW782_07245 [Candidatus Saganbacteria bacterium]|nr:hypothetical protein [Candidatus Saganbacteria bacterium]